MNDCPFESDVLDAIQSRRWPARAGDELCAHVASCEGCADLAAVAGALLREDEAAYGEARVPPAAAVWHRAQLQAREEAVRAATRPIGFVQGMAFAFGIAAALAVAFWGVPILASLVPDLTGAAATLSMPSLPSIALDLDAAALLSNTTLQIAVAAWAILAPLAIYFLTTEH